MSRPVCVAPATASNREGHESPIGHYSLTRDGMRVFPGPQSFHGVNAADIRFEGGKISSIAETGDSTQDLEAYELEPQLVTALFEGQDRSKRELIKFQDIPPVLVNAVLAIEDRRFFQHSGVNYFRLLEAALIDVREGRHGQGGSTHDHAAVARLLPESGEDGEAQADGDHDRHRAGAEILQAAHLRDVRQRGVPRPARLVHD